MDFIARGSGYTLSLAPGETMLSIFSKAESKSKPPITATLRTRLAGAERPRHGIALDELPGKANYYVGRDSSDWLTGVPMFGKVKYRSVYPGIDLVYYGNQSRLEYDFIVAPGANPSAIRMEFSEKARLDADGNLVFHTAVGSVSQQRPVVYQEVNGQRRTVAASYRMLPKNRVGFQIADYDRTKPLVIDPVILWARYVGGMGLDDGRGIAVASNGEVYFGGGTAFGTGFPSGSTPTAKNLAGWTYGFAAKLNANGTEFVYSNVFGGEASDIAYDLALDGQGNVYLTGSTNSDQFPLLLQLPASCYTSGASLTQDAFIVKFTSTGALSYSTKLGGKGTEYGKGIAVDGSGVYVSGYTEAYRDLQTGAYLNNYPTTSGTLQSNYGGGEADAFISHLALATTGLKILYSTYLGGDDRDEGSRIAVDLNGNAYVTGNTASLDYPTRAAYQKVNNGAPDAFVTKVNENGNGLVFSTYLGGGDRDFGSGIAVDASGAAYVAGITASVDPDFGTPFPTRKPFQAPPVAGPNTAFVSKFNPGGNLVYSTLLGGPSGGTSGDFAYDVAVDSTGSAFVTGSSDSIDFPIAGAAPPTVRGTTQTIFTSRLDPSGSFLLGSTLFNGDLFQTGLGIAVDSSSNAYMTGDTDSTVFPATTGSPHAGGTDAFVAKINFQQNASNPSDFNGSPIPGTNTIWFNANMMVSGLPLATATTIRFDNSVVNFSANGRSYSVNVPGSEITLDPSNLPGNTTYDAAGMTWTTTVPVAAASSVFVTGFGLPIPLGTTLPGGIKGVAWHGRFSTNSPTVKISWKWNAAVFTAWATDPNNLNVKPTDDGYSAGYANADQAGTPELYTQYLTKGGKAGKPTAWNWSGPKSVTPEVY